MSTTDSDFLFPTVEYSSDDTKKSIDLYLDTTKDALKQSVDGGRAIYSRTGSVLTQSIVLCLASFGSISIVPSLHINSKLNIFIPYTIYGLLVCCALWCASAMLAAHGMKTQTFGSISPDLSTFTRPEMYSSPETAVKYYLLKSQILGLKKCHDGSKEAAKWLNKSTTLLAISPPIGLFVVICSYFLHFLCY